MNIGLVCRSLVLEVLDRGFDFAWLTISNNFILVSFEHVCGVELGNNQRISFKVWLISEHHLYQVFVLERLKDTLKRHSACWTDFFFLKPVCKATPAI